MHIAVGNKNGALHFHQSWQNFQLGLIEALEEVVVKA